MSLPATFTITTTDKLAHAHGVKMLVYGPAGVGKTMLCSTAPAPIILSAEAGLLSLRQHSIPVAQIDTLQDLIDAYNWCLSSTEANGYQTVCLDSITEIAEKVLSNAKTLYKDPRQAYGDLIEKMTQVIKSFRDLPGKHVYMAAKIAPLKDELTGVVRYSPAMPGSKLGPQLPYLFDEVFRMGVGTTQQGETYRYLQTQPDLQYEAKDRSGALDAVEFPHIDNLIKKITGVTNNG